MNTGRQAAVPFKNLRTKLVLGFVGMLAILVAIGVESLTLFDELGGSIDVILRENYKSVIAAERMKEALERMDSGALFALAGEESQGRTLVARYRPVFEAALKTELGNITLPGEGERARRLSRLFTEFVPVLDRVLTPRIPPAERRALYFKKLYPTFQQIKGTADEIRDLNQRSMVEAKERARRTTDEATLRMALLLLTGTAFAGFCVLYLLQTVLWPLERLTPIGLVASTILLLCFPDAAWPQTAARPPMATDRPGLLLSSPTVGRGVLQYELGLPSVVLNENGGTDVRSTGVVALLRYGIGDDFELRLGGPLYTEIRTDFGPFSTTDQGYGDLEVGAKWRAFGNEGARPAFALIPSVILPTGETGFSAEDPIYQLNTMSEWGFARGWGLSVLAGYLNGPAVGSDGNDRYGQETFAVLVSRAIASWNVYGEAAQIVTDLDGADDGAFLGAGVKYLVSNDFQLDLSFDRGVTSGSPDWLFGLGLAGRF